MFINVIKTYRNVVAVADNNLIGNKFYEGNSQLDVKENFYKGEEKSFDEACEMMKDMKMEDSTFNIVGKESVDAAIKSGIINENQVGEISGIPFSLVLM